MDAETWLLRGTNHIVRPQHTSKSDFCSEERWYSQTKKIYARGWTGEPNCGLDLTPAAPILLLLIGSCVTVGKLWSEPFSSPENKLNNSASPEVKEMS